MDKSKLKFAIKAAAVTMAALIIMAVVSAACILTGIWVAGAAGALIGAGLAVFILMVVAFYDYAGGKY